MLGCELRANLACLIPSIGSELVALMKMVKQSLTKLLGGDARLSVGDEAAVLDLWRWQ